MLYADSRQPINIEVARPYLDIRVWELVRLSSAQLEAFIDNVLPMVEHAKESLQQNLTEDLPLDLTQGLDYYHLSEITTQRRA